MKLNHYTVPVYINQDFFFFFFFSSKHSATYQVDPKPTIEKETTL